MDYSPHSNLTTYGGRRPSTGSSKSTRPRKNYQIHPAVRYDHPSGGDKIHAGYFDKHGGCRRHGEAVQDANAGVIVAGRPLGQGKAWLTTTGEGRVSGGYHPDLYQITQCPTYVQPEQQHDRHVTTSGGRYIREDLDPKTSSQCSVDNSYNTTVTTTHHHHHHYGSSSGTESFSSSSSSRISSWIDTTHSGSPSSQSTNPTTISSSNSFHWPGGMWADIRSRGRSPVHTKKLLTSNVECGGGDGRSSGYRTLRHAQIMWRLP